jgi:hypothetical protein
MLFGLIPYNHAFGMAVPSISMRFPFFRRSSIQAFTGDGRRFYGAWECSGVLVSISGLSDDSNNRLQWMELVPCCFASMVDTVRWCMSTTTT